MPVEPVAVYTVEIDIPITRRLKIHAVVDANGEQVFHSRRISQVFQWLVDNEIAEIIVLDEDAEFRVSLRPPLSPDHPRKG